MKNTLKFAFVAAALSASFLAHAGAAAIQEAQRQEEARVVAAAVQNNINGMCFWQIPWLSEWINLSGAQRILVTKTNSIIIHYGYRNSYEIQFGDQDSAQKHVSLIMARIQECRLGK